MVWDRIKEQASATVKHAAFLAWVFACCTAFFIGAAKVCNYFGWVRANGG